NSSQPTSAGARDPTTQKNAGVNMKRAIKTSRIGALLVTEEFRVSGMNQAAASPDRPVTMNDLNAADGRTQLIDGQNGLEVGEQTGCTFIVENKTGGGGTIGATYAARAKPDGTTFLTNDTAYAMLPALFKQLSWDHDANLVPVTTLISTPVVLAVPVNSKFK